VEQLWQVLLKKTFSGIECNTRGQVAKYVALTGEKFLTPVFTR
jgi:hypothetical protein